MNAVVYGMLVGVDVVLPDTRAVGIYSFEGGKIIAPNEEGAVIASNLYKAKRLDLDSVQKWDEKIDSFCVDHKIPVSEKGWWLVGCKGND